MLLFMPLAAMMIISESGVSNPKLTKRNQHAIFFLILIFLILVIPFSSAGFLSDLRARLTGEVVSTVAVNISIGVPEIRNVYNDTSPSLRTAGTGLSSGPANTSIIINFSVFLATGVANMNNSTATINFSRAGEALRQNSSCNQYEVATNVANYTCNITMMWFDGSGVWAIQAFIADTNGNSGTNKSTNFSVGSTTGFEMGTLGWSSLAPGSTNQTASAALRLNNTGNKNMSANTTQINVTNLRGEVTTSLWIFANNISVSWDATTLEACDASGGDGVRANNMTNTTYVNITLANLTKGNYFANDGNTGQEDFYFCIKTVGSELTSQAYSTLAYGPWQVQILSTLFLVYRSYIGIRRKEKLYKKPNLFKFKPINI